MHTVLAGIHGAALNSGTSAAENTVPENKVKIACTCNCCISSISRGIYEDGRQATFSLSTEG